MISGGKDLFVCWGLRAVDGQVKLCPLAGGKWDILLFILFFSEVNSGPSTQKNGLNPWSF